ncbi:hypothetical protein [Legionella sp. WA2022007384]
MPKPVPPQPPEILLDVDGTCLDSEGKFNTNLFKALKTMGIKKANILSAFEMKNLDVIGQEHSFRCLVIDELKKNGIEIGYVLVNASPYLDLDERGHVKLGNYYHNTIEKFERKILNFRRKNQEIDLSASEKKKLGPDKEREQKILAVEGRQKARAAGEHTASKESKTNPKKSPTKDEIRDQKDEKLVDEIKSKLLPVAESFPLPERNNFRGGKERMLLHAAHHNSLSKNFIIFDDKEEVNNMVKKMDTSDYYYPELNGRMHTVPVFMKDRKQTEDYYIRNLIQGYSISQLIQFVETHAEELANNKQPLLDLLKSIPQEEEIKEKQKGIYAQLILACWRPKDTENIVELYQKLSAEESISEGMKELFTVVNSVSLQNPVFRGKILEVIIENTFNGKESLFRKELIEEIKQKTLDRYKVLAKKDSDKWKSLIEQISTNDCNNQNDIVLLRSSIQLGLAMEGSQNIDDLAKLMVLTSRTKKEQEKEPDLNPGEQEKLVLIEANIRDAIANTASNPQKFLELLRYYRELDRASPEKEILKTYLTPEIVQKNLETLTSLNPPQPQPWKFIGYPTLKEMLSKLDNEGTLIGDLNYLESTYPKGNPEIASLMISLITGFTDIRFYPGNALPEIPKIDTKQHQLNLLLKLYKQEPDTINKIKEQFIEGQDLESCLLLIEGINRSRDMSAEPKRALSSALLARIDALLGADMQIPTNFNNYLIAHEAKIILQNLKQDDQKKAVLKHAALNSLIGIIEKPTQTEAAALISRLNASMKTIYDLGNVDSACFAKESTMNSALTILQQFKGDIAHILPIDDFDPHAHIDEKNQKIENALQARSLTPSAHLFIRKNNGDLFYHSADETHQINAEDKQALNFTETQRTLSLSQFQKIRSTIQSEQQLVLLDPILKSEAEKLFQSYLSNSLDCYNFLKKTFRSDNLQQESIKDIAQNKVLEELRKTDRQLSQYLPKEEEHSDKSIEKNALLVIAYADYVLKKEKKNLNEILTLAKEIKNLIGTQDSLRRDNKVEEAQQLDGLIKTAQSIQREAFQFYLDNLVYNEETKEEITKLQYFQQNKENPHNNLGEVLETAEAVLTDVARLPKTKTDVLKALARTAQALVEPAHKENKKELQEIAHKFKLTPSLNLLGKALLVLLSAAAAGVGLFVAGGIVANQTYKDTKFFKALYKDSFKPEENQEEDKKLTP